MTITGKKYVECTVLGSGVEAEDSSYDSDYEAEDKPDKLHPDVSRTASDTLAAEFAEYVTVQNAAAPSAQTPGYTARVEFALKLGYTERLVQAALQKLGSGPSQNELLAELIKLGANPRLADTADETEALLPEAPSENASTSGQEALRPVIIDGSNVAMSHGNKEVFSCRGIKICVEWFRNRGHQEITVFVPKYRKESSRPDNPVVDQEILGELERDRLLVFTPSRLVGGKRMVCYDDRYILRLAAEVDGIVVSNDNYRDLAQESPEFRRVIEERILMYSFVNDRFMPPDDPLGRTGPTLDNFLKAGPRRSEPAPPCPYAKKCTYGNKCKFRHPERGPHPHKSVTERLVEHAQRHLQARSSLPLSSKSSHASLSKARSWAPGHLPPTSGPPLESPDFSKSKSVENVAVDLPSPNAQASLLGWVAPRVSNLEPEPANMHRKLQRQLSLNPSCDPRLNHMRRYQQASSFPSPAHAALQNRLLTRHANDSYSAATGWEQHHHQHVTRIASAPDSYRAWSRPRLGNANKSPTQTAMQRHNPSDTQLNQDARRHLHYHLANIFPAEQVQAAMALHPNETDPQQICAAILSMFSKF